MHILITLSISLLTALLGLILNALLGPHLKKISNWSEDLSWVSLIEKGYLTYVAVAINLVMLYFNVEIIYRFLEEKTPASREQIVLIIAVMMISVALANSVLSLLVNRPFEEMVKASRRKLELASQLRRLQEAALEMQKMPKAQRNSSEPPTPEG